MRGREMQERERNCMVTNIKRVALSQSQMDIVTTAETGAGGYIVESSAVFPNSCIFWNSLYGVLKNPSLSERHIAVDVYGDVLVFTIRETGKTEIDREESRRRVQESARRCNEEVNMIIKDMVREETIDG